MARKSNEQRKKELDKKKASAKNFLELYDDNLGNLMTSNMKLQEKALNRIDEMIGQANAVQAATIYGILHDKVQSIVGKRDSGQNTVNMYFGDSMSADDRNELLTKVLGRMDKSKVVDADYEVKE